MQRNPPQQGCPSSGAVAKEKGINGCGGPVVEWKGCVLRPSQQDWQSRRQVGPQVCKLPSSEVTQPGRSHPRPVRNSTMWRMCGTQTARITQAVQTDHQWHCLATWCRARRLWRTTVSSKVCVARCPGATMRLTLSFELVVVLLLLSVSNTQCSFLHTHHTEEDSDSTLGMWAVPPSH